MHCKSAMEHCSWGAFSPWYLPVLQRRVGYSRVQRHNLFRGMVQACRRVHGSASY